MANPTDDNAPGPTPEPGSTTPPRRGVRGLVSAMVGAGTAVAAVGVAARRNGNQRDGTRDGRGGRDDQSGRDRHHDDQPRERSGGNDHQPRHEARQHDGGNHAGGDHRLHDFQIHARAKATETPTPTGDGGGGGGGNGGGGHGGGGGNGGGGENPFLDHLGNRAQSLATKAERMAGNGGGGGNVDGGKIQSGPNDTVASTSNITFIQGPNGTTIETSNISFSAPAPTVIGGTRPPRGEGTPGPGDTSGGGTNPPLS